MKGYPPRLLALCERCPQAMLNRDYWTIKDFVLVKEVGSGAASTVYYALCRKSTQPVAIKMYLKAKLSKLNRRQVEREINIHSSLSHPHIIDFYAAFEDDERIYLVQEYAAGGDLFDDVKRRGGRLSEREVVQHVLYPYLKALAYLHGRGIIHRDIKPENTVFTKERVLKVTDFGLAINAETERPVTRLGTLDYMAPEVLRCPDKHSPEDNKDRVDLEYDDSVDAWAMGVLAYELIVGRPPFGMSCREVTMRAIVAASPSIPDWMSPGAADFIRAALQRTSARRLPVEQLLLHPWITNHVGCGRLTQPIRSALNLSCGAEAAAAMAAAAVAAAASSAGGEAVAAATGVTAAVNPLFYHPGGPYKHLMAPPQSCNSASASELGGGRADGVAVTAAMGYGSDQRPSKRQVHRCQSASMDAGAVGCGGGGSSTVLTPPGVLAQQSSEHPHVHRLHDNMSYWMTDGNGFSRDPLFGLAIDGESSSADAAQHQAQLSLPPPPPTASAAEGLRWVTAAAAAATAMNGIASPINSPMAVGRAQEFYRSQLARAFADAAAAAVATSSCSSSSGTHMQDQAGNQAYQQQQQQQEHEYHQQLKLQINQRQMSILLQQHQQHQQQQMLLLHQQQQQQLAAVEMRNQQQLDGDAVSRSGECIGPSGPMEPSVPPLTAADYYRLHLEDIRIAGGSGRAHHGPRGLSRSFTVRHAGRPASNAGGSNPTLGGAVAASGGGSVQSPIAARLLRNVSSSSGGSMKRRTPDTHDWDLPQLPTNLSVHQLQVQYMPAGRTPGGGGSGISGLVGSPLSRNSDAFAALGGAAAFYTGAAGAGAATAAPGVGCLATPFSHNGNMSGPAASGQSMPMLPTIPQLGSSLSLTSFGSMGGRPSRLSKAFRRVDSMDPGDSGFGRTHGSPGSDGSGSGCSGSGSALPTAALPMTQYSGTTAAMAALDQLTLTSTGTPPPASAAPAMNRNTADLMDDDSAAARMVAALQQAACMRNTAAAGVVPTVEGDGEATAGSGGGGGGGGGGGYNNLSDSCYGSSAAASTAMTAASLGGTSGLYSVSGCSFGFSAASGISTLTVGGGSSVPAAASLSHRTPSITTCGAFSSAAQGMAALRLSLPTSLPRLGLPAAGSATGSSCGGGGGGGPAAVGLRSHPLSSPQITPWSTPLGSPAASKIPRMHSQPPGASSFNALLDLMEADGVMLTAEAMAEGGTAAGTVAAGAPFGGSSSGSVDASAWTGGRMDLLGNSGDAGWAGGQAPMQVDETGGGAASSFPVRNAVGMGHDCLLGGAATSTQPFNAGGPGSNTMANLLPLAPPAAAAAVQVQQMSPEDRWAVAWAAAAAASSNTSRTTPVVPTTPPSLGRAGSTGFSGGSAAGAGGSNVSVHAPSPLGRDQPYQQALAAVMQQHIRSRSLNRFQIEQLGLTPVQTTASSGGSGGGSVVIPGTVSLKSPFAVASPPISPRGVIGENNTAGMGVVDELVATGSFTAGGGGGGAFSGGGGGSVFGNRLSQQSSPSASLRGSSFNAPLQVMGTSLRSFPHYGVGSVQCGGSTLTTPSPLGLRCSRSRASNGSSDDTSGNPLPYIGSTGASRPSDSSYERPRSQ